MRSSLIARLAVRLGAPTLGALTALSLLGFTAQAHATADPAGHVYVLENPAGPNSISTYDRAANGALTYAGTITIGGLGTGNPLGSQGSLTRAGDHLFAVDGASNQISVVAIHDGALTPVGLYSSRGALPVSVASSDGRLYVVNSGDVSDPANVAGFTVADSGALTPIPGANATLSAALPGPAQVAVSPDGRTLAVTEKNTNIVDTYRINSDGSLGARHSAPSAGQTPFGFAFIPTQPNRFVVSDASGGVAGASAVTGYRVSDGGAVVSAGPVADHQTAACWLVITANGKYAYTANAGSGTLSGYRIGTDGSLSLLNASGLTASTGVNSHPLEMTFSPSNHDLYVLDAFTHTLSAFTVGHDGALAPITLSGVTLDAGAVGLAAD